MTPPDHTAVDMRPPPSRGVGVAARRWHDLGTRTASGLVLIVLALGSARIGGNFFLLVWLAAAAAILWEWQRLVDGPALVPRVLVGSLGILLAMFADKSLMNAVMILIATATVEAVLAGQGRRIWAAGGIFYAGLFLIAVLALRSSFPFGARSIIWLFATVWSADIFAYFGGRLIGGPKLWPRVSPSKTWSGSISGIVAGGLIGTFVALRDLPTATALAPVLALTLVTAIVSQIGDGFESAMKRRFSAKDSGHFIPGHGGAMDRLDGFIAAAVFAFMFGLARDMPSLALSLFYWA